MIKAGFTIHNPITNSKTVVLESDLETNGMGWLLEIRTEPGTQPDVAEHLHLDWTETFEILSGTAHYKLNGVQKIAQAGEKFVVKPHEHHIHPWNAGETEMVYRQSNQFAKQSPQAVQEVLGVFATIAGLAREGQVDTTGRPKNPLQLAATMRVLTRHGGYDSSLSVSAQNFLSASLGLFAELLGYRGVYSKFLAE
jgi:hypothetical protein